MRYFRIGVVILFMASVLFSGWARYKYDSNQNMDRPVLTNSVGELELSVNDPEEAIFNGLSAQDETDGDLTHKIMIASISHFLEPGTVNVKYVVFDSHNNSASLTRRVHYTDYESPKFVMKKAPIYMVGNNFDLMENLAVIDALDGDISDRVRVISNMVNNYSEGVYPVILEVSNSCGDTSQLQLWVHYVRQEQNVSIQLKQYAVYHPKNAEFDPYQYIASVTDENFQALDFKNVKIQGSVDTGKPGFYQLVYSYAEGKLAGKTALTVIVTEEEA